MLEGFVDVFLLTRSVVDDLRSGRPTVGFGGGLLAHLRRRWESGHRPGPDPDVFEAWVFAVGDWDADAILPSWLWHGAPTGILEEVETAGVFTPGHGYEQPRNPASLYTCPAGWSNYASAEDEPEIANQLL